MLGPSRGRPGVGGDAGQHAWRRRAGHGLARAHSSDQADEDAVRQPDRGGDQAHPGHGGQAVLEAAGQRPVRSATALPSSRWKRNASARAQRCS